MKKNEGKRYDRKEEIVGGITCHNIKFDYSKVLDKFVAPHEVGYMQAQVTAADELIRKGAGAGSDFLGWLDLPENYDREEFDRILKAAEQIKVRQRCLGGDRYRWIIPWC